jgi:PhnB protein
MQIQPYLFFNGRCEEAVDFYRNALGAEVEMMMRFKDSPDPKPPGLLAPGFENKVMHASLRIGGAVVMASDGMARKAGKVWMEHGALQYVECAANDVKPGEL